MHTRLLSALAMSGLVIAGAARAQDKSPITITYAVPGVGDRRSESDSFKAEMDVDVYFNGNLAQKVRQTSLEKSAMVIEILAVDGKKITKIKVAFEEVGNVDKGAFGDESYRNPVSGNTYVVELIGGKPKVTGEASEDVGKEITGLVWAEVAANFSADPNDFKKMLPDRPLKIGELIAIKPELAKKIFDDPNMKEAKMALTVKGRRKVDGVECIVFDLAMKARGAEPAGPSMGMDVKGELVIEIATGFVRSMNMKGPMTMAGEEKQENGDVIKFKGKGTVTGINTVTYKKAARR